MGKIVNPPALRLEQLHTIPHGAARAGLHVYSPYKGVVPSPTVTCIMCMMFRTTMIIT